VGWGEIESVPELLSQAIQVLERARDRSELRDLWEESEAFDSWKLTLGELQDRCSRWSD